MKLVIITLIALSTVGIFAEVGDFRIGVPLEPPNLDPTASAAEAVDIVLYNNVFEGLTKFAADGTIVAGLASHWQILDSGGRYLFQLQHGVQFHDGSDFDADDVVFSLSRAGASDSVNPQKANFAVIKRVAAIDRLTVEVELQRPDGNFLFTLAGGDAVMVAKDNFANNARHPIGTGPFRFLRWRRGDRIELLRNPDYWGRAAQLPRATFKFISDATAAYAAMMSGNLEVFYNFPGAENLVKFANNPAFKVLIGDSQGEVILAINHQQPPFEQLLVRKAISLAINRQDLIDGAMYGYGTPIGSHFSPQSPDYLDLTGLSGYDPQESRRLLAAAGYPDGFTASLKLPPPLYARRSGEIIASQLRQVGIRVKISYVEWAQWLEEVYHNKDYQLTIVAHTEPLDIGIYARSDDYYFQYDNPQFRQLFGQWQRSIVAAERQSLLQQLQTVIAKDYANGFLFQLPQLTVAKRQVGGLWLNPPTPAIELAQISWLE